MDPQWVRSASTPQLVSAIEAIAAEMKRRCQNVAAADEVIAFLTPLPPGVPDTDWPGLVRAARALLGEHARHPFYDKDRRLVRVTFASQAAFAAAKAFLLERHPEFDLVMK
jgi:DNA repair photolyase